MTTKKCCPRCGVAGQLTIDVHWKARPIGSQSLAGMQLKTTATPTAELSCGACGWSANGHLENAELDHETGEFTMGHFVSGPPPSDDTTTTYKMLQYTIYHRPLDFPGVEYLVREFRIHSGHVITGPVVGIAQTVEEARALVPPQADAMITRSPEDDPAVVETWI